MFHDVGKPDTAEDDQKSFPGHDKKGAEITKSELTALGFPKDIVKRVTTLVENHLFVSRVGLEGQPEEYRKLALVLGADVDRFFKMAHADSEAHKKLADYDSELVNKVEAKVRKVKAQKPDIAGTEDLKKSEEDERFFVEDSLNTILKYDVGLTDVEYMLELVEING